MPVPPLPLHRSGAPHDRPDVYDRFPAGHVITIVNIDAGIEIRWIYLDSLAQLDIAIAIVPEQHAVFGAANVDAHAGPSFDFVSSAQQCFISVIDRALVRPSLADNR